MIMVNMMTIVMVMISWDMVMMALWSQYYGECDDHGDGDCVKRHGDDYGDDLMMPRWLWWRLTWGDNIKRDGGDGQSDADDVKMIVVMTLDDVKLITVMINVMLAIIYRDGGDGHGDDENVKRDGGDNHDDADIIIEW